MCRYGSQYKQHYACFHCRKMFRRPHPDYLAEPVPPPPAALPAVACPQCGGVMHNMGLDFKAPRQDDEKQWRKVEILFQHGFTYHSCGCCGPGLRPAELRDVEAFLADQLPRSEGEKLLKRIAAAAQKPKPGRQPFGQPAAEHPLARDAAKLRRKTEAAAVAKALLQKKRRA